jgi:alpha-glucosidase
MALAADRQEADPASPLRLTRRLIALRRAHPALMEGRMEVLHADAALLVFTRTLDDARILCAFNLSDTAIAIPSGLLEGATPIEALNGATTTALPPFAALLAR